MVEMSNFSRLLAMNMPLYKEPALNSLLTPENFKATFADGLTYKKAFFSKYDVSFLYLILNGMLFFAWFSLTSLRGLNSEKSILEGSHAL